MQGGASQATVHGVAEVEMTGVRHSLGQAEKERRPQQK